MLNNIDNQKNDAVETLPATPAPVLTPVVMPQRSGFQEFDDLYIAEYLRYPEKGKTAALRRSGHPNVTRARAWQIHDRLSERIDSQLNKLIKADAALGRATLVSLCKSSQSDSVRAACATKLMEYADKTKPQRILFETDSLCDIDKEIEQLQERIKAAQNIPES